ncbi:MAG: penicillin-binding protein 1C, partial [Bacteroidales bacterium]
MKYSIGKYGKWLQYAVSFVVAYYMLILLLSAIFPPHINTEYSKIILSRDTTLLHAFLTTDDKWRMYTRLDEITPELKSAIVFKEDKYFYYHPGINPVSIVRAALNNLKSRKRTSGASTITMQVARLLEPKERTYKNKLKEIFRATQLEISFTKDEILQMYLNLVPFGSNIEGVKSASVIYFGKMPNHLSIGEIAALSIIPNRPVSLQLGDNNEYIYRERNKWLNRYKKAGLFDDKYIEDARREPLMASRREIVRMAPHLSYRLKSELPGSSIIYSSIEPEIQLKAEKIVKNYVQRFYFQNIKNATAIIIDNTTREVLAYVGSADFENNEDGGQVDGIRAVRSPGSTLKPLLYAVAFDKGIVTPKTVITDVPVNFSGYEPENYDEQFHGNITIENALASSLNVPAVKILAEISPPTVIGKLIEANFHTIKQQKDDLGLSLILGGCGVELEELSALYSALANQGIYKNLKYRNDQINDKGKTIVSKEAAFMITEILTQLKRPDYPVDWDNTMNTPKIAWKTGTSYGRRDAWSIGYNKNYTVGVWMGNFSGEGVPELNGADKATPLLFQLFNAIDNNSPKDWFVIPDELGMRYVCSQSGLVPGEFCHDLIIDYYLPGISSNQKCSHLKKVYINPDSTMSYCTSCPPETGYKTALYPNLAPEIITYFEENNIHFKRVPPHNPECERLLTGSKPEITSPIHDNEYYVNVADSMQVMLSCHTAY